MTPTVSLDRVADLTDGDRAALASLSRAVYPPEEAGNWPGLRLEWAPAEWCVRVRDGGGEMVSHVGVRLREATHDGRPVRIGGVGGVKTHPAARGRGHAALGVRRAVEFFQQQGDIDFALLVCEPRLIEYYSRLGWQERGGRLLVSQFGETAEFTFNRVMVCAIRSAAPLAGTIDLMGPPW